jgi:adenylate cyclase class IV
MLWSPGEHTAAWVEFRIPIPPFDRHIHSAMPANIEIKARIREWDRLHILAAELAGTAATVLDQVDTFFSVPVGRLKLRQLAPNRGELIFYQRPDQPGPKLSDYIVTLTAEPAVLRDTLAQALGVCGEVRKRRWLFLAERFGGHTRIHLDEVRGLGQFIELEVVLESGQSPEHGERITGEFRAVLDIRDEDLIDCAYLDLVTAHSGGGL